MTALLLTTAVVAAYRPVFDCGFVNYDDNSYVYDRNEVKGGLTWDHFKWAFANTETVNWYPLTWISLQIDASIWGVGRPFGFHLTNLILHIADTLLLFWVLTRMTGRLGRSALVAGLFALHPLHVESVAWITERKDVLSALFWMLALAAYVWYAERPHWAKYLLVASAFAFGLLAKSMLVTLPCVLFLLDFWPLRRYPPQTRRDGVADSPLSAGFRPAPVSWRRLIAEKIPLFLLAAASTAVTIYAQQKGGESNPWEEMPVRLGNAAISYVSYVSKTLWPVGLVPYYPFPKAIRGGALSPLEALMAGLILLAVTVVVSAAARRRPYLVVGWLWFLGTLAPVIGVIQVIGDYAMADRFTYIPLIGLFLAAVWGAADALGRAGVRPWLSAVAALVLLGAFAAGTWQQVGYWHDSITLWTHTLQVNPKNHLAYNNLGHVLLMDGEEIWRLLQATTPKNSAYSNADLQKVQKKYAEAEGYFRQAIQCDPSFALAHYTLAYTLDREDRWKEAATEYQTAADYDDAFAYGAGHALSQRQMFKSAIHYLEMALRKNPNDFYSHLDLGWALFKSDDVDDAVREYQAALGAYPNSEEAHRYLGEALLSKGDIPGAVAQFQEALRIKPNYADGHDGLAEAYRRQGDVVGGGREHAEAERRRRP